MRSTGWCMRLLWVAAGVALLSAPGLYGAEYATPSVVPDKLPAVVKGTLSAKAKAEANAAKLKMPLEVVFNLPTEDWMYEGVLSIDRDGPVSKTRMKARARLRPQATDVWPVTLKGDLKTTEVWVSDGPEEMMKASREDVGDVQEMPPVEMDKRGRVATSYDPGQVPLAYLSDLWGLPLKPLDIGDSYVEEVSSQGENAMGFQGVRHIKLLETKIVNGAPCAVYVIASHLELKGDEKVGAKTALRMDVASTVTFDTSAGWPLEAKQQAKISGVVSSDGPGKTPFLLKISFDVKRVKAAK